LSTYIRQEESLKINDQKVPLKSLGKEQHHKKTAEIKEILNIIIFEMMVLLVSFLSKPQQ
jgi:hypothetical protein